MIYFLICHGTESLVHPVTGHTVLHSACVEGSKLCAKVVLQVSGGGIVGRVVPQVSEGGVVW